MVATLQVKRKTIRKLPKAIKGPRRVKVGFPAGKTSGENLNKAVWNEFGTRGGASGGGWGGPIPERPFMRNMARNNKAKYAKILKGEAREILLGTTSLGKVMRQLGIVGQQDVRAEIDALMSPANSPVTIARKGSSKPLIDTGRMRRAVTYKVED